MFTSKSLTFFYAVTPVHMGAGQALGVIDNPIQRERHTEHPCFAGSGIKGALRHAVGTKWDRALVDRVFGPEQDASDHAGAISFADAQLVAFPVRSLKQVFAYVTSPLALQRLGRLASVAQVEFPALEDLSLDEVEAVVLSPDLLASGSDGKQLILESYAFRPSQNGVQTCRKMAQWLAQKVFAHNPAYDFFRKKLEAHLVVVSDTQFTFFVRNATLVEPHVRINDESGTADDGGLFFTENLPPESILVSLTMASQERLKKGEDRKDVLQSEDVLSEVIESFDGRCVQIGGDASTGRGQVLVRFVRGGAA